MTVKNQETTFSNILGVVLAGGKSSRMQSDKALLTINGVTNLDRAITTLKLCKVNEVTVSGHTGISDDFANGGPLAGLLSVINAKQPKAIIAIPVDMPLLSTALLNKLIEHGINKQTACCFENHFLPIFMPVTEKLISFLTDEFNSERFIKFQKGPSFKHLLKSIDCEFIKTSQLDSLANANTPSQWEKIINTLK